MSKRFAWLLGLAGLVLVGFLLACGTIYNSQSNGLVIVGSQGAAVLETYSFDLNGGGNVNGVSNPPESTASDTCVLNGFPGQIVIDPKGAYAYTIINSNSSCPNSKTGIQAFSINSSGEVATAGSIQPFRKTSATPVIVVDECGTNVNFPIPVTAPVNPQALVIDSSGKYLFVADNETSVNQTITYNCNGTNFQPSESVPVPGTVSVFSIGSGGSLTEVAGSPFSVPGNAAAPFAPQLTALAVTPTTLPPFVNGVQTAVCAGPGNVPFKSEYLYVTDANNNMVWEFQVNTSTGALTNPPNTSQPQPFPTATVPQGVAVDPCSRFVYVSGFQSNQVSGYTICDGLSTQSSSCPKTSDWRLVPVAGSPFSLTTGSGPGPLVVDPFGNYLYVLDTQSNQITPFHIAPVSGSLTPGTVVSTGSQPKSLVIRGDDNWLFVANYGSQTFSQFQVTPQTGALAAFPAVDTDNYPWGIAVK